MACNGSTGRTRSRALTRSGFGPCRERSLATCRSRGAPNAPRNNVPRCAAGRSSRPLGGAGREGLGGSQKVREGSRLDSQPVGQLFGGADAVHHRAGLVFVGAFVAPSEGVG